MSVMMSDINSEQQKQQLLEAIAAECSNLIEYQSGEATDKSGLIAQFFRRAALDELQKYSVTQLANLINGMSQMVQQRSRGELLIRAYNPSEAEHGWDCANTVLEMVNDDMPFLVDTVSMILAELGHQIQIIIHPVVWVARNQQGKVTHLLPRSSSSGQADSLMHIQIERQLQGKRLTKLVKHISDALDEVRLAVADWQAMRKRVQEIAERFVSDQPREGAEDLDEAEHFLRWLDEDNFTFLGLREYEIHHHGDERELHVIPDSGKGILRRERKKSQPRKLKSLSNAAQGTEQRPQPIIITKTNSRSRVHRSGYMDYIGVLRYNAEGKVIGEYRILGLFTSGAYNLRCVDTPLVRRKAERVMKMSVLRPVSHEGKALMHILETMPRDELMQSTIEDLHELAMGVLNLQERPQTRLFIRRERYGRFYSCMVFIPRDRFNTENREKIQAILQRGLKGEHDDFAVQVSESTLARLHVVVRPHSGTQPDVDTKVLQKRIVEAVRSWHDELRAALIKRHGEHDGIKLSDKYGKSFPVSYSEEVSAWVASFDVDNIDGLQDEGDLCTSLYVPRTKRVKDLLRFKLFRFGAPLELSRVLPMLENLGVRVINERPYHLECKQELWIQDFDILPVAGISIDISTIQASFRETFERVLRGQAENDGFNRLVIAASLDWRQVAVLRAYCRYLLQTRMPFSQTYVEDTLVRHPVIGCLLVGLFESMFAINTQMPGRFRALARALEKLRNKHEGNIESALGAAVNDIIEQKPKLSADADGRQQGSALINAALDAGLQTISSLDEDRIIRNYYETMIATLRTNFYQQAEQGEYAEHISFKLISKRVPELPKPYPYREIWVHSPRVEGIHLRMGPVARGGLRWSDRKEDFRTEVLGLMKAQNVKNTMIVPVGAKGGFVVKHMPEGDRDVVMQEVVHCYQSFINGLLEITDNVIDGELIKPVNVVCHDKDDTYLVVAADKGTATFSDTANAIAAQHKFWLGDAFASGGSNGYDHKGMGITAKGAWESVKRHFRELGVDTQSEPFSVIGIGDMGGDVFGNGMLLSEHIRLQAAFNHLHIFIDPDPDPAASFQERKRLFELPRSSWQDYDEKLISKGGGVFSRAAKSIKLSKQLRAWLGTEEQQLTPLQLIHELLKAPCDLLWNGGIGTYIKASSESHADVGDRVNNAVRVDATQLRCKVVGEGGNLGLTQLGRMEFAMHGGRVNSDFIDNSAGVDCSDHEVNIKILLDLACDEKGLGMPQRNQLLRDMTPEVEQLVLRSNYLQTQALSMMESFAVERLGAKVHLISSLENRGVLDRQLEFLPDNEMLRERAASGQGLTRPELAVLLSYSKISLYRQLLQSEVPEDQFLARELVQYFPKAIQERYADLMEKHPLKREIIATRVTNSMVNRMGASFVTRIREDTGADAAAIAKAYAVAREVFQAQAYWTELEAQDATVAANSQIDGFKEMWDVVRQATRWLLNRPGGDHIEIQQQVKRFGPGIAELYEYLLEALPQDSFAVYEQQKAGYLESGFTEPMANRIALLQFMTVGLDIVDEAAQQNLPVRDVLNTHFAVAEILNIDWLRRQVETLSTSGNWEAHARGHLRNDLITQHRDLTSQFLHYRSTRPDATVSSWQKVHQDRIQRTLSILDDMRRLPSMDIAAMTVAVRSLEQLVTAGMAAD